MKKLALFLVVFLVLGSMAASADTAWPFAKTAPQDLQGSITVWHWHSTMEVTYPAAAAASGFNKKYPGIKVNLEKMGDGFDRYVVALAANTGLPSICFIDSSKYGALVEKDAPQDLTERMLPYKQNIFPVAWNILDIQGRVYAMPDVFNTYALYYRRDLFTKAGYPSDPKSVNELVSTWDKYIEVGKKIKQKTGAYLVCYGPNFEWNYDGLEHQMVSGFIDKKGKVLLDSPEVILVAKYLKQIWDAGLAKEYQVLDAQWFKGHKEGEFSTRFAAPWMTEFFARNIPETKGLWGLVQLPAFKAGSERGLVSSIAASVISKGVPDKEKEMAWRYLESLYTSVPGQTTFMTGETGWFGNLYAWRPAIESLKDRGFDFLGGQKQYDFYLNVLNSTKIVPPYQPAGSEKAAKLWSDSMFKILDQHADVEATLKAAADQLRGEL